MACIRRFLRVVPCVVNVLIIDQAYRSGAAALHVPHIADSRPLRRCTCFQRLALSGMAATPQPRSLKPAIELLMFQIIAHLSS